ncbi:MAG: PLP-dependent transferase [Galbitalea sp.]
MTFASLAGAGDHIVASANLYGGSITQLDVTLRRFGVETTFITSSDPADYDARDHRQDQAHLRETIANPSGEIADIEGLAEVAHAHHLPLIIDSTIATPYLNRPLEWGADVVIHSATKFLGGHGTTLGASSSRAAVPLGQRALPQVRRADPHLRRPQLARHLRRIRVSHPPAREQLRDIARRSHRTRPGCSRRGVETLPFRIQAHVDNARIVAEWLDADPAHRVRELGRTARHPHHERANKYLPKGPGSVFSFGVKGGREVGQRIHRVGWTWPAIWPTSATRRRWSSIRRPRRTPAHRAAAHRGRRASGLVRLSVGIEDPEDIVYDLDQALTAATKGK